MASAQRITYNLHVMRNDNQLVYIFSYSYTEISYICRHRNREYFVIKLSFWFSFDQIIVAVVYLNYRAFHLNSGAFWSHCLMHHLVIQSLQSGLRSWKYDIIKIILFQSGP